jgi:dienelactone hydrolase
MNQSETQGFLAVPQSDEMPGVLVLHAWWWLNDTMKNCCRQLADSGFMAFAPDLYHGKVADAAKFLARPASASLAWDWTIDFLKHSFTR